MIRKCFLFSFVLFFLTVTQAAESRLYGFLKSIDGAVVTKVDSSSYSEFYVLMLPQKVDHADPSSPVFLQRIFIGHKGYENPTILVTEGYGAEYVNGYSTDEPTLILNANQVYVEHRYFGASVPENTDWKFLTAWQDASDYHYIRQLFSTIYPGKWVATGVSKGGQTSIEYNLFYPGDVDATIAYVAPLNYKKLDPRINRHFRKVGTPECRKSIRNLQMELLKKKPELLPLYEEACKKAGFHFNLMEAEKAYDYSVLEFPFSFWQYHGNCSALQGTMDEKMLLKLLLNIVSPYWYTDAVNSIRPAFYQFYTQLGYYEYNERPFRRYLKYSDYPNSDFVPPGVSVVWDASYQKKLKAYFRSNPDRILFVYGGIDPWGATAAKIKPGSKSLKLVQKDGTHAACLRAMDAPQKALAAERLSMWLNHPVVIP